MIYVYIFIFLLIYISGWLILWKVPTLQRDFNPSTKTKSFSIIIPARNEAHNLPILLESISKQSLKPLEVIVVDDDSQDNTAAIARQFGARVLAFLVDETNWVGKSAACWRGAQEANGEWLLFLDADIFLPEKDSLAAIVQTYQNTGARGVLSIQPYHVIRSAYENFSVIFNILVLAGMNRFSFLGERLEAAGAFGPSFLCDRDAYFKLGGHRQVKDSIMENIALGKYFLDNQYPLTLYGGKGTLHFRMYPDGLRLLTQGWSKSFASASGSTHPAIIMGISLWISCAFITFFYFIIALLQGDISIILIALAGYLLYFVQFLIMSQKAGQFHWVVILCYPILFLYFVATFIWSTIQTHFFQSVSWKGRKINL